MKTKTALSKKIISVLLCITLILAYIPFTVLFGGITVFAAETGIDGVRIADDSTIDGWKKLFTEPDVSGVKLTTENAGGVWTDKSVFLPNNIPSEFSGAVSLEGASPVIEDNGRNFLISLSAIASNKEIVGYSTIPTDTVFVLDLSSSMRTNDNNRSSAIDELVAATNKAITDLLALNKNNRISVVLYSGNINGQFNSAQGDTVVLLPLDSYTPASTSGGVGSFLSPARYSGNNNWAVTVSNGVKNSNKDEMSGTKNTARGTFLQDGIYEGMKVLRNADPVVKDGVQAGVSRIPIMLIMTDGEGTLANRDYDGNDSMTDLGVSEMYNYDGYTNTYNNRDSIAFMTQLTAAFAKKQIRAHYKTEPLFYTLAYGRQVNTLDEALSVLDPKRNSSEINNDFWTPFFSNGRAEVYRDDRNIYYAVNSSDTSKRIAREDMLYVDKFFPANSDEQLATAFKEIVDQIKLQSKYYPTYVEKDHDHDGYITFTDKIGEYMEVTDVKGFVIGDRYFSGETLAKGFGESNLQADNALGTVKEPTALGREIIASVMERIGIEKAADAEALINNASSKGQLFYSKSPTGEVAWSNYIGWFANSKGEYLSYWYDGRPASEVPGATHIIKSYGFLGDTDDAHGVSNTDMLYATLRVTQEIGDADGDGESDETLLVWRVPASLIPTITYNVDVDINSDGKITGIRSVALENANVKPIRLLYEVALRSDIKDWNLTEKVDEDYYKSEKNKEKGYVFYTNQWKSADSSNPGDITHLSETKRNTYSHFEPSVENERYYYTENSVIYTDQNGTEYTGNASNPPDKKGTYYRAYNVYEQLSDNSYRIHTHYEQISEAALSELTASDNFVNGKWVIRKGVIHRYLDNVHTIKASNRTGTHSYSDYASVVYNDENNHYYTYDTHGNNGRFIPTAATGIKLSKELTSAVDGADNNFTFVIAGGSGNATVVRLDENGNEASREGITFQSGKAEVVLKAAETVYIIGLANNTQYTVTENRHNNYRLASVNGDTTLKSAVITAKQGEIAQATFTNAPRKTGNLTISKVVTHDLGANFNYDADTEFEIEVDLDGEDVVNTEFDVVYTGTSTKNTDPVVTDADGKFKIYLKNNERFEILGLTEGTVVNGTELYNGNVYSASGSWYEGFSAPKYWDSDDTPNDDSVTIVADKTVTAGIENHYTPSPVEAVIDLDGIKTVRDSWPTGAEFTFELQEWDGADWNPVATDTASATDPKISFEKKFPYTALGEYSYQVVEVKGSVTDMTYDTTKHSFTVTVTDDNKDGKLEIASVVSDHSENAFTKNGNTYSNNKIDFVNYFTTAPARATLDIQKDFVNPSGSNRYTAHGFEFKLFDGNTQVGNTAHTDVAGEAQIIWDIDTTGLSDGDYNYTYTLKETKNADSRMDWADDTEVKVKVTVAGGKATATVVSPTLNSEGEVEMRNTYTPKATGVKLDVEKKFLGGSFDVNTFEFELKKINSSVSGADIINSIGANSADGKVEFNPQGDYDIEFTRVGTYYFSVSEKVPANKPDYIDYDDTVYTLRVTVTDNNGELNAETEVYNQIGSLKMVFNNIYTAKPVSVVLKAKKALSGRALRTGEFEFALTEVADANGTALANPLVRKAVAMADGTVVFDEIEYTKTGTHYYAITETIGTLGGVEYDKANHIVTVKVKDDKTGQLVAEVDKNADKTDTQVVFNNKYTASGKAVFQGQKYLIDGELKADAYTFILFDSSDNEIARTNNAADGSFSFSREYTEADIGKTYTYTVKELYGGEYIKTEDSKFVVSYDDRVYTVTVDIVDRLNGTLYTNVNISDSHTRAANEKLIFTNRLNEIFVKDVVLASTPEISIDGKPAKAGDVLEYTLDFYCPEALSLLTITDTIPDGTVYVENSATENGVHKDGVIAWEYSNLTAGTVVTVSFKVTVKDGGAITNQAKAVSGNNEYATNTVKNNVPSAELKATKEQAINGGTVTDKVSEVKAGDKVTYYISVENSGKTAAYDVTVIDTVPKGLIVDNDKDINNDGVYNNGTITWKIAAVNPNEKVTVSFTATVPETEEDTVWRNIATVVYDKDNDNKENITTTDEVEIELEKPVKEKPVTSPKTGDRMNYQWLLALLFISSSGAIYGAYTLKKDKKANG